jgi:4-amino-4-deoxy-L-arabinose transferase-like glycosyltransferase
MGPLELAKARPYLILALLSLALYLPGLTTLPPTDRDEARFAQASRQMLESRDFVRIRFQEEPRHKKPAGIYWLQAGAAALVGPAPENPIWPYRLPSVVGAVAAVLITFACGRRLFDDSTAALGAALTASSLLVVGEAHLAKTDAVLLATTAAAQGALGLIYVTRGAGGLGAAVAFWAAQGLGILVKGPILPVVSLLTAGALVAADRSASFLRALRPRLGIPLLLLLILPWAVSVTLATDGAFFRDAVGSDLLPKLISGQESHGLPPGFFLALLMVTFWPGSLFVLPALARAWGLRARPGERFCLAWVIPAWVLFELVPTKLPHYVLPLYPALALLTARVVLEGATGGVAGARARLARAGFGIWAVVSLALGAGIVATPLILERRFEPITLAPALVALAGAAVSFRHALRGRSVDAMKAAVIMTAVIVASTLPSILPGMNSLWVSRSVAQAVSEYGEFHGGARPRVAAAGYYEPSLVFLLGTDTRLVSAEEAANLLQGHQADLALVSSQKDQNFLGQMRALNLEPHVVGAIRGFNYTKGRWVALTLYSAEIVSPPVKNNSSRAVR